MEFITTLGVILGASVAAERTIEVIKPLYVKIKNNLFKTQFTECTKTEKEIMSIFIAPVICLIANVGIDLPGYNEPVLIQYLLAGLVASLGSNVLHALMSIIIAIKDSAESVKNDKDQ